MGAPESHESRESGPRSDETGSGGPVVPPEPEIGATGLLTGEAQ